jgi:hypothetical protein
VNTLIRLQKIYRGAVNLKLGRFERVELRDIWETEDRDFTPWLAQENHIELLSDAIGMELEVEAQEKEVGPFRADILCRNTADDSWVLIENQIEKTDHRHLGQLMTYAAGLQAVTIVWVAAKFTEEHRASLDWLNKITGDEFHFFGLEVELWRIDDSIPAPKFNIVSKPNNWSKSITSAAQRLSDQPMTDTKRMQLQYWRDLASYLNQSGSNLRPQEPRAQHWCNFSIGRSGIKMTSLLNTKENRIGIEICMFAEDTSKAFFNLLQQDKDQIEAEVGEPLIWKELPDKIASRIVLYRACDPSNEADRSSQHDWLKSKLELMDSVFRSRIRELNLDDWANEESGD